VESARREQLQKLMAAIAAGDRMAPFKLRMAFDSELKAAVRRAAAEVGRALPSDEVEAVATDFCTWLIGHAAAWRPDGALPWRWAWAHLTTQVRKNQGYWPLAAADPRDHDIEETSVAADGDHGEILHTFAEAAGRHARLARVRRVLEATSGPTDVALLLEYAEQVEAGDPSPSHTVASRYELRPDAVRKRVQRARARARVFMERHPEHGDLADLPIFDPGAVRRRKRAA